EAYAFQFSSHSWLSNEISSIESAGPTQDGRELDLVAPGEVGWALCSTNVDVYEECTSFAGDPAPIQQFGGTSESAPFIAAGAALVIQGYRDTHGGQTPSPALVRRLLTGTANDLGLPSFEQGAGEMDTLAAGPAARVGLTLIDPNGDYAAYTRPQGDSDHGEVDVHAPVAGTWTAIIFRRDGTFNGPVHFEFTSQRYGGGAPVTPSAIALAPGQ